MSSYIPDHRDELKKSHYIPKAGAENYRFDFTHNILEKYNGQFRGDFCLVLYASDTEDDAYIIPYHTAKRVFTDDLLDGRGRWIGSIRNQIIRVHNPASEGVSIAAYYNNYDLL